MADAKISALTAATVAAAANELAINEAGTSKRLTVALLRDFLSANLTQSPTLHVQAANYTAPANVSFTAHRSYTINSGIQLLLSSGARLRVL